MGWMGGLGQGMLDYSNILSKQQEMEWKSKESQLANERQMNLERMRMANQEKISQVDFERRKELLGEQRAYEEERAGRDREAELEGYKARKGVDLETATGIKRVEMELEKEASQTKLNELHQSDFYMNAPPEQQKLMDLQMSTTGKLDLKTFTQEEKGLEAPTSGHFSEVMKILSQSEAFNNQPAEVQLITAGVEALKLANPKMIGQKKVSIKPEHWEENAKDLIDGKISAAELWRVDEQSYQGILQKVSEMLDEEKGRAVEAETREEGVKARQTGFMTGPNIYGMNPE